MSHNGGHSAATPVDGEVAGWLDCVAGPPWAPKALRERLATRPEGIRVGRGEECDVILSDSAVSRIHCAIRCEEGSWSLIDLGSTHGTFVDGRRIAAQHHEPLRPGASVGIGPWILRLRQGPSDSPMVVAPPERDDRQSLATRPTIFLRLRAEDSRERELSWQTFRERYAPVIVGFARHAGLSGDEAEDVLQDVLLAFFRVSPRFEYDPAKGRFRGYLKRATLNVIRRRRRRAAPQLLAHDPEDGDAEDPHLALRWEEAWESHLAARALEEVRRHVDPRTWEAFELYVRREIPAEEVARRLGLAVNSVHQAKSRVLRSARELAERLREEEG